MVAYRLNLLFRPDDFGLGQFLAGQPLTTANGELIEERLDLLRTHAVGKVGEVRDDLLDRVGDARVEALVRSCSEEVRLAVEGDSWNAVFPGRWLMKRFASSNGLGNPLVLQNSLVKALGE